MQKFFLSKLKRFLAVLSFSGLCLSPVHQALSQEPAFKVSLIKDNIFLLSNKGGNIAVSQGVDGLLVIDNGNANEAELLAATLKEMDEFFGSGKPANIAYIINTHWHDDHSGANNLLGHSADIIAHDNVRKHLGGERHISLFDLYFDALEPQGLPTITYPEQVNLHINGDFVSLKHYGVGHSDSDSVVFFSQANVVHMGDSMVYPMFPFIDIDHGGNALTYVDTIRHVLTEIDDQTIVIPGHGGLTDKAGVEDFLSMLELTIEEVKALKSHGLSNEQIQQRGLSDQWDSWNHSIVKEHMWIDVVYRSL